jgi:hypothetical protein
MDDDESTDYESTEKEHTRVTSHEFVNALCRPVGASNTASTPAMDALDGPFEKVMHAFGCAFALFA